MDEYIGIIKLFAGNFAPRGWLLCNGATMSIAQNSALFSILGSTYGGDGVTTFALPDLRGRVAVGAGAGPGLSPMVEGQRAGSENVTPNGVATHTHDTLINNTPATTSDPSSGILAQPNFVDNASGETVMVNAYAATTTTQAHNISANTGAGSPSSVMQPYLGLNYIICIDGVYPSRP